MKHLLPVSPPETLTSLVPNKASSSLMWSSSLVLRRSRVFGSHCVLIHYSLYHHVSDVAPVVSLSSCSLGAWGLLRSGWHPVSVRHHPDHSLLQNQGVCPHRPARFTTAQTQTDPSLAPNMTHYKKSHHTPVTNTPFIKFIFKVDMGNVWPEVQSGPWTISIQAPVFLIFK